MRTCLVHVKLIINVKKCVLFVRLWIVRNRQVMPEIIYAKRRITNVFINANNQINAQRNNVSELSIIKANTIVENIISLAIKNVNTVKIYVSTRN